MAMLNNQRVYQPAFCNELSGPFKWTLSERWTKFVGTPNICGGLECSKHIQSGLEDVDSFPLFFFVSSSPSVW